MVFQCYPIEEVNAVRCALGLSPVGQGSGRLSETTAATSDPATVSHKELKRDLCEIGRIQDYIADEEYQLESTYLDVVWRRVERSVPTFVFEVQIGGDIYHAMAKLKHAFDLWNSHIFVVGRLADKRKYEELISGSFHEVAEQMKFINAGSVKQLLGKKLAYKQMERDLGILRR
jgi:hypothetical protein